MQIRHSNMLAQAHSLLTTSEPRLVSVLTPEIDSSAILILRLVLQAVAALASR